MLSEFYPLMFWILGAALARSLIFPCYTLDVHYYTIPDLIEKISERLACVKWGKVPMHMGNIPTMESPKYKKTAQFPTIEIALLDLVGRERCAATLSTNHKDSQRP